MIYKYGYRLRPPSIGTEPKGYFDWECYSDKQNGYWGWVGYQRELTEKEMFEYDLDRLEEVE